MELPSLSDRLRHILNELEKVTDAMEIMERQKPPHPIRVS